MALFPPNELVGKEHSSKRSESFADPAIKQQSDGGYTVTRPRYTRAPQRTWTIGFTNISQTEKELLEQFWIDMRGGSNSFTWRDQNTDVTHTVRFDGEINYTYVGAGIEKRWDVSSIKLKEV